MPVKAGICSIIILRLLLTFSEKTINSFTCDKLTSVTTDLKHYNVRYDHIG